ncbi:hypothetical protein I6H08_36715 (plasmid) [Burkholderia gladioli]|uniref:DUF4935 domain-containing protein n=3 Tax=Burkholderia gladioli TaxID=28095 RepID=A0AAW3F7Z7_BURGA|nr:hypothetical protein [Burkholderia gladioli]AWY49893.1 hypothetical protein A8H28_00905 [Burkholderia gladioli pv. gladioli]KGC16331.1 hypothetical protein DM48_3378 [Burkholderia gladioli]QPQ89055.1 hypothetical protein I6H08_36715 [Burkholderia gladioli]SPU96188.1 Uncharacterised protein [Burkholderia gladioli]
MPSIPRKLIPDDQCIVVLDTSPVRDIAYESSTPPWVATFEKMADAGYSFSLADNAVTELLNQRLDGRLTEADLHKIHKALAPFLNPDAPVLPGKKDLLAMIGESEDLDWSEAEVSDFATRAWAVLCDPSLLNEDSGKDIKRALQDDREDWTELFKDLDDAHAEWMAHAPDGEATRPLHEYDHPQLDKALATEASRGKSQSPSIAERQDLMIRYIWRQWVRTRKSKEPYDPTSDKKINDGIDLDLYRYLMLPAFVVAGDNGFHGKIADLRRPQLKWFWRPQDLADAWERGDNPRPAWN